MQIPLARQLPRINNWKSLSNQRNYFDWLSSKLGLTHFDQWYEVSSNLVHQHDGGDLLTNYYNNSLRNALSKVYPEVAWHPWRFVGAKGVWDDITNHKNYFIWLQGVLHLKTNEDWYKVCKEDLLKNYGGLLLNNYYKNSLHLALQTVFPEYKWLPWRFAQLPKNFWDDIALHREYFDWLQGDLQLDSYEGWYGVSRECVADNYGGDLLSKHYENSLPKALQAVYPHVNWQLWRFGKVNPGFWHDIKHQKQYFDWLAQELNVKEGEQWFSVPKEHFKQYSATTFVRDYHGGSHMQAVEELYNVSGVTWKNAKNVPLGFWADVKHQREYFDWLGEQLGIEELSEWYGVTAQDILAYGGNAILGKYYQGSPYATLRGIYPEYHWLPWKFGQAPRGYWDEPAHHKEFFDWLSKQLNIKDTEDWYNVTVQDVWANGGSHMLQEKYENSLVKALRAVYPGIHWQPWKFGDRGEQLRKQHRQYFDWLGNKLDVKTFEDWYKITNTDVVRNSGGQVLAVYEDSLAQALQWVYPEVSWVPWKFGRMPLQFWMDNSRLKGIFTWLEGEFNIGAPQDWLGITHQAVFNQYGKTLMQQHNNSLKSLLSTYYPSVPWNSVQWRLQTHSKNQTFLQNTLKSLLPSHVYSESDIELNFLFAKYKNTRRSMRFDVWIPSINLVVEYQGSQHYTDNSIMHGLDGLELQFTKDLEKKRWCTEFNLNLLQVPYWWESDSRQLATSIEKYLQLGFHHNVNIPSLRRYHVFSPQRWFSLGDEVCFEPAKERTWNIALDTTGWWSGRESKSICKIMIFTDGWGNFFAESGQLVSVPHWVKELLAAGVPLAFAFVL